MRSLFLLLFAVASISYAEAQVPKIPLIEHFTQASCSPCASANPILKTNLDNFGTANYVRISHQVSWPGVDPMNAAYPTGPNDRRNYYGITGVPNTSLNGDTPGSSGTVVTSSTLASAAAQTTPYQLNVEQTWLSSDTLTVNIKVKNTTASAVSTADRIRVVMVEDEVTYPTAPGSNGETSFEYVMRAMYNPTNGTLSTTGATLGSIAANDSVMYSFTLTGAAIPSYIRDISQVSFAAFLQNNSTKVVHQAGKSEAGSIPGVITIGTQSASVVASGRCNRGFTPAVTFTNTSTSAITTVTAQYAINNGTPISQTFNGNLAPGQSTTITFPATNLAGGSTNVSYTITDVNNGGTVANTGALNIGPETYDKLMLTNDTSVVEGFETAPIVSGYSRSITTGIFEAPATVSNVLFSILDGPTYGYGAIGAFAQSNRSIRFRFYNLQNNEELDLLLNPMNLGDSSSVTFSRAAANYTDNAPDRLDIAVSTDCGATWSTPLWTKSGPALATIPGDTMSAIYVPTSASHWVTETVDLSAYNNMNDVLIRFRGTSAWGNNLFLDDINIYTRSQSVITGIKDTEVAQAALNIMPNPVHNEMTVQFDLPESAEVNITIYNALGQQVQNVTNGTFGGMNTIQVSTNELASGVYLLNLASDKGLVTKRFTVEK